MPLDRLLSHETIQIASGQTTSAAFSVEYFAGGSILCPAGYAANSAGSNSAMTFEAAESDDGTFAALLDKNGTAVGITLVADRWFALPEECFMVGSLKLVVGGATVADEDFIVVKKG